MTSGDPAKALAHSIRRAAVAREARRQLAEAPRFEPMKGLREAWGVFRTTFLVALLSSFGAGCLLGGVVVGLGSASGALVFVGGAFLVCWIDFATAARRDLRAIMREHE